MVFAPLVLTSSAYIPTSLAYVIPMTLYRPDVITPEARAIPQKVRAGYPCEDTFAAPVAM